MGENYYVSGGFLNKKFLNTFVKKGKKYKIESFFYKFYYNFNLFLLKSFYWNPNSKNILRSGDVFFNTFNSFKFNLKTFVESLGLKYDVKLKKFESNTDFSSFSYKKSLRFSKYITQAIVRNISKKSVFRILLVFLKKNKKLIEFDRKVPFLNKEMLLEEKENLNVSIKKNYLKMLAVYRNFILPKRLKWRRKSKLINSFFKVVYSKILTFFFYYRFFSYGLFEKKFKRERFLFFDIILLLKPSVGVRMVAVGKKSIRKKKSIKLTGIPISLKYKAQVTAALTIFKKSLGLARPKKIEYDISQDKFVKKKEFKKSAHFKRDLLEEITNFYFFGVLKGTRFKKDLYAKVLRYKNNSHFRWNYSVLKEFV